MNRRRWRSASALLLVLALPACARVTPPVTPLPAATTALAAGITAGPSLASLGLNETDASAALASFVESCPKLLAREDASGLTRSEDWQGACDAASAWNGGSAIAFFATHFTPVRVSDGAAFATGYFEPEIAGCRTRQPGCEVPVYGMPGDLVRAWPADIPEGERTGRAPLGRTKEAGVHVPYYTRAEIDEGALEGRGLEIAWAADAIEFFFLQIQGSGRLKAPDGEVIRIGYAGQNGHEYVAIGRVLRERGHLGNAPGQYPTSMQGIVAWLRDNPDEGRKVMQLNPSWVFFRELKGDGPLGALGVPVRRESSVAADPNFVPLGAPVWLDMERDEADGLWIAQDTGGAIKGANRFDTFWGAGEDAREIAGAMSSRGSALVFLPKPVAARLAGE
ncbi:murein transglycosylase A [Altererythrobacter sp. BO-6]|uniref:murein transglycosylase A n=1 Tax=Altererythrobacter sp. BO-6 TaxID=2604537 RepID=UPI0013E1A416|nr:murein transglycosylase A [Altererythrobacter sp. BO-6]QIG53865.1 murein transglycosylase A [Altererythrobacter sp. BO-6]